MALKPKELAKRVRAARAYAGLEKQADLGELMKADGLGVTDPGRLERPNGKKKPPPLTQARLDSLVKHTGLPPAWFTEEEFSEPESDQRWDLVEEKLNFLLEAIRLLAGSQVAPDEFRQWWTNDPRSGGLDL